MLRELQGENRTSAMCADGFTLIEVLMAMTIFAIGIMAVFSLQVGGMRGSGTTAAEVQVAHLAQDVAEDLLLLPYDDASLDDGDASANGGTAYGPFNQGVYTWSYTVYDDLTANTANTKTIAVRAAHPNGRWADFVFVKVDF